MGYCLTKQITTRLLNDTSPLQKLYYMKRHVW
jgi:hypothetical protein